MLRSQRKNRILSPLFISAFLLIAISFQSFTSSGAATETTAAIIQPATIAPQSDLKPPANSVNEDIIRLDERLKVFMWAVSIFVGMILFLFGLGGYFISTRAREHSEIAKSYSDLAEKTMELLKLKAEGAIDEINSAKEKAAKDAGEIAGMKEHLLKDLQDSDIGTKKPEELTQDDKKRLEEFKAIAEQIKEPERTAEDYFYLALAESDIDRKIELYKRSIELKPDYAAVFINRGVAYDNIGEYNKAIADCNEAIRLKPDEAVAFNNRGNAYGKKGEYDKAIEDYNEAIRLKPDYADAYNNRGNAYCDKGEYDSAIADFNEAIRLKPDYAGAFNNRGTAHGEKGEYDKAIVDYNEAIRLKTDYADAFNNRGNAYGKKGEYDKAIEDYNEAIRLKPDYAAAFSNRGVAYHKNGEYERAFADYNEAIRLKPDDAAAFYNKACAFALRNEEGDNKLALEELRAAVERGYSYYTFATTDPDLDSLRELPEFKEILEMIRQNSIRRKPGDK